MAHLDEEQLLHFTLGTLEHPHSAAAAAHVDTCADCRGRQQTLATAVFAKTVAAPIQKGTPTQPDRPLAKATTSGLTRGTTLGRYVLLERLGTGGMGEVFAAFDPQLDRKVALKLLRGGATSANEGRARLLREAQAMARLQHPNVVAVHDVGTFDDRVFIAMEFIDGETLSDWLRADRPWRDVVRLFLQAGSGLAAAHRAGLIHRDFKPDNVLIGVDGRPRVLDFGLARQATTPGLGALKGPSGVPAPTPTDFGDETTGSGVTDARSLLDDLGGARRADQAAPQVPAANPERGATPHEAPARVSSSPPSRPETSSPQTAGTPPLPGQVEEPRSRFETPPGPPNSSFRSTDSGLAVLETTLTLEGAVMGTPGYMAPEQLAGLPTDERCDQFAFSVALYEALYGKRPFGGATLATHAAEITLGRIPPPPPNSPVPDYLFGVIKHGLAANPDKRYPDMDALLAALRPRRRRSWRTISTIATLAIIAALGIGYAVWSTQRLRVCGGSEQRLVGVWDGPTKEKLRAAFEKTGSAFAAAAWKNTARTLDAWALNWANGSREACEASRIRKVDSPALYEMKTVCLDMRLQRLRALTHLFEDADRDVVGHASAAAASLEPVASCFDLESLTRRPMLDEHAKEADAMLQTRLSEARALFDAGKYARGVDVLRSAISGDSSPRAQAEAFLWLGRLMLKNGTAPEAHAANVQAAEQATRSGDAALQAIAFARLYGNEGFDDAELSEATEAWSRLAHAAASRVTLDWEVQYELALNDALVSLRARRLNDALSQFERALSLVEEHRGPSHPDVASMHDNLGVTFSAAGDFAAAIEQFDRSFALHVTLEGLEHPSTAMAEGNLAIALRSVGRFHEAIAHFEHSLTVRRATLGDTHPETLKSFESLARAYLAADRREEALALLQRTLEVRIELNGPESREVGLTLDLLVEGFKAGGYWREAHDFALRELAIMRKVSGPGSLSVATALVTMGALDTRLGNWSEARAHLLEAQRIRSAKLGESSNEVAAVLDALGELALANGSSPEALEHFSRALVSHQKNGNSTVGASTDLVGIGRAELLLGQTTMAVQALERALSLHSASEDPKALAVVKLELGRALWVGRPDAQARGRRLLVEALTAMVEPARGEAVAALLKRGIVVELSGEADAGQ